MQRNYCVTKNKTIWVAFLYKEDANELAKTQQEADRAGHTWKAREMTKEELGEGGS